jgi:hypothetical protein
MTRSRWQERNRDAFNAAWRRWYGGNAARKMAWQRRRKLEIRGWWRELKSTKQCERCGERAVECLQFHHDDPRMKVLELSRAVARAWSKERILAEAAKCRVWCANCHLKHHWNERRLPAPP